MTHPACSSSSWTASATGCRRCTSTASGSTSPPPSRASSTRSTGSASFFDIIHQDPLISQVKLIAEPWDVGEGGYQVGNFPARLGRVERPVPRHASAASGRATAARSPTSPTASRARSDLYEAGGRRPSASINFVTAHDGFTLARPRELQRQAQRGQRRGEPRRHRRQPVLELRGRGPDRRSRRSSRSASGSAQLPGHAASSPRACRCCWPATRSGGPSRATTTPTARTTSISWVDWALSRSAKALLEFTRRLIRLRLAHPSSTGGASSRAAASTARRSRTSPGSGPTARR